MEKLWDAIFRRSASAGRPGGGKVADPPGRSTPGGQAQRPGTSGPALHQLPGHRSHRGAAGGHVWEAGNDVTLSGQPYIANIPTEELYRSPQNRGQRRGVRLHAPGHDGYIIDEFHFVVKDGKIVEAVPKRARRP